MKIIIIDNMFEIKKADSYIVTANSYIKESGELTMGVGAALQLANMFPEIPEYAGFLVKNICGHLGRYGYIHISTWDIEKSLEENEMAKLKDAVFENGLFQVKCHFKNKASLALIEYSIKMMQYSLIQYYGRDYHTRKFVMNYPGIGYGGLSEEEVLPLIEKLPDNFIICKQSES